MHVLHLFASSSSTSISELFLDNNGARHCCQPSHMALTPAVWLCRQHQTLAACAHMQKCSLLNCTSYTYGTSIYTYRVSRHSNGGYTESTCTHLSVQYAADSGTELLDDLVDQFIEASHPAYILWASCTDCSVSILCLLCDTWHIQQPCVLYGTSIYTYRMSSYSNGGYTESTHNHAGLAKKVSVVHHQATPASAEVESARKEQA